jgi:putative transposase
LRRPRKPASPFRSFDSSLAVIRLIVLMHVRFPLASRNVVELLFRRGIDICHDTVRTVKQGGPIFADGIGRQG